MLAAEAAAAGAAGSCPTAMQGDNSAAAATSIAHIAARNALIAVSSLSSSCCAWFVYVQLICEFALRPL